MNNKNITFLCGSKAVAGKPGTRGMTTAQIKKFIETRAPASIKNRYNTMQAKEKTRGGLCRVLSTFREGIDLLKSSTPADPRQNAKKVFNNVKRNNKPITRNRVPFVEENLVFAENLNVGRAVGGSNNLVFGNANIATYIRPNRKKNVDPFATGKLSAKMKGKIRAKLQRMKRLGKLPNFKSNRNIALFTFTEAPNRKNTPKISPNRVNMTRSFVRGNSNMAPGPAPGLMAPMINKRYSNRNMFAPVGNRNSASARIPTRSNLVGPNRPMLSPTQLKNINNIVNSMYFNSNNNRNATRQKMINNAKAAIPSGGGYKPPMNNSSPASFNSIANRPLTYNKTRMNTVTNTAANGTTRTRQVKVPTSRAKIMNTLNRLRRPTNKTASANIASKPTPYGGSTVKLPNFMTGGSTNNTLYNIDPTPTPQTYRTVNNNNNNINNNTRRQRAYNAMVRNAASTASVNGKRPKPKKRLMAFRNRPVINRPRVNNSNVNKILGR